MNWHGVSGILLKHGKGTLILGPAMAGPGFALTLLSANAEISRGGTRTSQARTGNNKNKPVGVSHEQISH